MVVRARFPRAEPDRAAGNSGWRAAGVIQCGADRAELFVEDFERLLATVHEERDVRGRAVDPPGDRDVIPAALLEVEPRRVFEDSVAVVAARQAVDLQLQLADLITGG